MNARSVTAAPHVPFRRFLPHEKPLAAAPRARRFEDVEFAVEQDVAPRDKIPFQLISDEDMSVLMEARLQDTDMGTRIIWQPTETNAPAYIDDKAAYDEGEYHSIPDYSRLFSDRFSEGFSERFSAAFSMAARGAYSRQ